MIGVDISPIQPEFVPPNCRFELDDCCSPWTYPTNYFDLIHVRCMFGSVADWPQLYREIYDHLEPGGYVSIPLRASARDFWSQKFRLAFVRHAHSHTSRLLIWAGANLYTLRRSSNWNLTFDSNLKMEQYPKTISCTYGARHF